MAKIEVQNSLQTPTQKGEAEGSRKGLMVFGGVLLLPILYLLSSGPAIVIIRNSSSKQVVRMMIYCYSPMEYVEDIPVLWDLMQAYWSWWEKLA